MALDWSKEVSFSGLRKSGPKPKTSYPTKTYMNLAVVDKKTVELRKAIPLAVLLIVIVVAFVKFGVYDFYDNVFKKQAELAQQEQTLSLLEAQLVNYDEVLEEYEAYESSDRKSVV